MIMGADLLELLRAELPLHSQPYALPPHKTTGLAIVDEVNGFCTVGCGNLAPPLPNAQVSRMVDETNRLAREFSARNWPMLVLMDSHDSSRPEPPYPPHCIKGSGEDELVPALKWLVQDKNAFLMPKDCINGYIGGMKADGSNLVGDWVRKNNIQLIVVVGICTDICVLDLVGTLLSARNHGVLPPLEDVLVYTEGCATYDLPKEVAEGMDGAMAHPQALTHHMGLYIAKSRGAQMVDKMIFP